MREQIEQFEAFLKKYIEESDFWLEADSPLHRFEPEVRHKLEETVFGLALRPAKRFRPYITMKTYSGIKQPNGQFPEWVLNIAACVEIIHTASLIIDDIQDHSYLRRGGPSVHRAVGIESATNWATWGYFWALKQLERLNVSSLGIDAIYQGHFGQGLDLMSSENQLHDLMLNWSVEELTAFYKSKVLAKSARLFVLGPECVLKVLESDNSLVREYTEFLEQFGVAFQIVDDVRNLESGDFEKFQEDLRAPFCNYAFVEYFGKLTFQERKETLSILRDQRVEEIAKGSEFKESLQLTKELAWKRFLSFENGLEKLFAIDINELSLTYGANSPVLPKNEIVSLKRSCHGSPEPLGLEGGRR